MSEGITSTNYSQLMEKRDYYQSEARRCWANEKKAAAFKLLADDYERKARTLSIEEAGRHV